MNMIPVRTRDGFDQIGRRPPTVTDLRLTHLDRPFSIAEQIADRIAEGIIRNETPEATWLRETPLAERFKVSRGPIREAFRLLEGDGMLELHANRGAMVSRLSRNDIWQVGYLSEALVVPAIRVMVANLTGDLRESFFGAVKRIKKNAGAYSGVELALDIAVLSLWSDRVGVGVKLENISRSLFRQTLRYTSVGLREKSDRLEAGEALLAYGQAIYSGDAEQGAAAWLHLLSTIHRRAWKRYEAQNSVG